MDENGFDRRTSDQKKFDAVASGEGSENGSSDGNPTGDSDDSPFSGFMLGEYAIVLVLVTGAVLVVTTIARNRLSRSPKSPQNPLTIKNHELIPSIAPTLPASRASSPPPPPPMIPPLPPGGLPPGWSMEQWHYYGEEYLRRYYPTEAFGD